MKTDIILIKYNNRDWEDKAVQAVIKYTDQPYHLTVYDNYPQNNNIGKLWNKLIDQSDAEYICLLNTDAEVTEGWLYKLLEVFEREKLVGCVGPTTNHAKNHQNSCPPSNNYDVVDFAKTYEGECLGGFCLVFPKYVWEDVGGFDENFGFYGQEVNLLDKMTARGYKQIWRKDAFVWHEGQATVKKEVQAGRFDEQSERRIAREKINELRKKL